MATFTCQNCGRKFNSNNNSGVSYWVKNDYCSRRCERVAKNNDTGHYKAKKAFNKFLVFAIIIGIIIIAAYQTCSNDNKTTVNSPTESRSSSPQTNQYESENFVNSEEKNDNNQDESSDDFFTETEVEANLEQQLLNTVNE